LKRQNRKVPEERNRDKSENFKAEIRKLRKEVLQLRKENDRLRNRDEGLQDLFEEFKDVEQDSKVEVSIFNCPHCKSSNVRFMSLRHENSHFTCNDCGKTGPIK
jgi:predicted RNA-binding Zn-ribbon protein involved in translation (DUF1610 family)